MQHSDNIQNLAAALVKFQGEVETVRKTANNPFFRSKYATLAQILDVVRQPLADNGLAVSQFPTGEDAITTILLHKSGEYIMETSQMSPEKRTPQALGSAITYARRYALSAVLGLNIDDDDDGNAASAKDSVQTTNAFKK